MIRVRLDGRLLDDIQEVSGLGLVDPRPGQLLWVHCEAPDDPELNAIAARFHVHPLAIEDLRNSNQRPKLDDYGNQLFLVLFGAIPLGDGSIGLAEVHFLLGNGYLVTVSTAHLPALDALEKQLDLRSELGACTPDMLLYRICDSLVDSVFPLLDGVGRQIDEVEEVVLTNPARETVRAIFDLKRDLLTLRRITGPQRDLLQSLTTPRTDRIGTDTQLYLRDVYDHAVRIAEEVDSFRDLVSSLLDAYLTSVSNRLGEQTRRLTVVANFSFLVGHIASPQAFFLGLSLMAVSVPTLVYVVIRLNNRADPLPPDHIRRGRMARVARSALSAPAGMPRSDRDRR